MKHLAGGAANTASHVKLRYATDGELPYMGRGEVLSQISLQVLERFQVPGKKKRKGRKKKERYSRMVCSKCREEIIGS